MVGAAYRTHDANGSLTLDGTKDFEFDYRNNLTKAWQGETLLVTYEYDCFNRRTKKCCDTERYYYDGLDLVEVYNINNALTKTVVQGQGIDEPMVLIARDLADLDEDQDEAEFVTLHYHRNMLGSITHLTWDDEEVVESYEYTLYGEPTIRDGLGNLLSASAVGNTLLFTSREWDVEVGLYYYRFRTYDPGCGRFLQRDPLGCVDGANLYVIVFSLHGHAYGHLGSLNFSFFFGIPGYWAPWHDTLDWERSVAGRPGAHGGPRGCWDCHPPLITNHIWQVTETRYIYETRELPDLVVSTRQEVQKIVRTFRRKESGLQESVGVKGEIKFPVIGTGVEVSIGHVTWDTSGTQDITNVSMTWYDYATTTTKRHEEYTEAWLTRRCIICGETWTAHEEPHWRTVIDSVTSEHVLEQVRSDQDAQHNVKYIDFKPMTEAMFTRFKDAPLVVKEVP